MNIIVVGCGRVGAELAFRIYQKGHKVTVIDHIASAFNNLDPEYRGRVLEGEALNQDVLERAGIETADGLAAVTNSDSLNAVVSHIARSAYGISNVVVRNYDPHWRSLHEAFELQIVGSSSWGAQRLEEMLYSSELHTVFSAGNGEVEIYEFAVPKEWAGCEVDDLIPSENCRLVSVTRSGKAMIPTAETRLQEGDIVLVSATFEGVDSLRRHLLSRKEG